ncbi:MAG: acyl-CoA dehydrogenase family protein, partial [SAR86 cluster bacterium]|nr:acyl-CoA dehydrogenase family protein [SAR86 cluster bacterium]
LDDLKEEAKKLDLWNLFLPDKNHGPGLSNLDYAPLAEIMGRVWWSSEVFNCSAPDTGNMEILAEFGTDEQKKEWLDPLLEGKIRSCFAMTEPDVASSDATNISSSIVSDGDNYVINGRKWWTSNAINPRAEICIFMGITNPDNPPHQRQSQVLVPMNTEGVEVIRPMHVFGYDDGYTGHPEVKFENVVVPKTNLIGGEGIGFKIAQARLGPGR